MFNLSEKVAIVTGASSGIGHGMAKALASQGASVVLVARRKDKLDALALKIVNEKQIAIPIQADVTSQSEVDRAVVIVIEKLGRVDILVNNAGVYVGTPADSMKENDWDKVIDTDLKAYAFFVKAVIPQMKKQNWGRIINIASVAMGGQGFGIAGGSAYAASKGGIIGLTESLAVELAPFNILVNAIAPGLIISEMTESIVNNKSALESFLPRIPLKRAGKPEEVASLAVYLASDESSYTTGSTMVVDGGWLAS